MIQFDPGHADWTITRICIMSLNITSLRFNFSHQEEKLELNKLLERVPIPVKESIEEPSAKVFSFCKQLHSCESLGRVLFKLFCMKISVVLLV